MEISSEIINGKPRTIAKLKVQFNGKEETVKLKKLNFGEFNEVQRASMKVTMIGTTPKLDLDSVAMNENAILRSIVDAPFVVSIQEIRELEKDVAEEILAVVNELNNPTDKKKED